MPEIPKTLKNHLFVNVFGGAVWPLEDLQKCLKSQKRKKKQLFFNVFGEPILALEAPWGPEIPKTLKNNLFFNVFGGAVLALEALQKGLNPPKT